MTDHLQTCPLCSLKLDRDDTCPGCALSWDKATQDENNVMDARHARLNGPVDKVASIHLRQRFPAGFGVLLVAMLFVAAAGVAGIYILSGQHLQLLDWIIAITGLTICALFLPSGVCQLLYELAHTIVCAHVAGDPSGLRVRVWHPYRRTLLRRSDVRIPLDQLRGISYSDGQGRQRNLFLVHASGHALYLWDGDREDIEKTGAALESWLSSNQS